MTANLPSPTRRPRMSPEARLARVRTAVFNATQELSAARRDLHPKARPDALEGAQLLLKAVQALTRAVHRSEGLEP
jgi:hypothetical protein